MGEEHVSAGAAADGQEQLQIWVWMQINTISVSILHISILNRVVINALIHVNVLETDFAMHLVIAREQQPT
jgi:hypothetical protein